MQIVQYSQVPIKRVYSIIILRFFSTLLHQQIFTPTRLFGTFFQKFTLLAYYFSTSKTTYTLLVYLALLSFIFHQPIFHPTRLFGPTFFYEICSKYPPYSFIWPYSFNWHLRVVFSTGSSNISICLQLDVPNKASDVFLLLQTSEQTKVACYKMK